MQINGIIIEYITLFLEKIILSLNIDLNIKYSKSVKIHKKPNNVAGKNNKYIIFSLNVISPGKLEAA